MVPDTEQFLRKLGITQIDREFGLKKLTELYAKLGVASTADEIIKMDWASGEANPYIYASKEIASLWLSLDYDRLYHCLNSYRDLTRLPKNPKKIVGLGSGPGVLSIYLATLYPNCKILAYDRSKKPLKIGHQWAKELGLNNISFIKSSYLELADSVPSHDCDLVILYNSISLPLWSPLNPGCFLNREAFNQVGLKYPAEVDSTIIAMKNLLNPMGLGVISPFSDEWGLTALMEAIRKADLKVVWDLCLYKTVKTISEQEVPFFCILVNQGYPEFTLSSLDSARALMSSFSLGQYAQEVPDAIVESYSTIFENGTCLVHFETRSGQIYQDRLRLLYLEGLLLLEFANGNGCRYGLLHSFVAIAEFIRTIKGFQNVGQTTKDTIIKCEVHPSFSKLAAHYGLISPPSNSAGN